MKCNSVQDDIAAKVLSLYGGADIGDPLAMILSGLAEFDRGLIISLIPDADEKFLSYVKHVSECEVCAKWSESLNPARQKMLEKSSHYCCMNMFKTVDGAIPEIDLEFKTGRGSYGTWYLNSAGINFCPWCGTKLGLEN
ncbi:MAG: hypothetical protein ABJN69_08015 [Hellea sp.]